MKTEATLSGTCESRSARAKLTTDLSTRYIHLTVLFTLLCLHPRLRIRLSISIIIIADRRVKNKPTNYTVLFSIVLHVHSINSFFCPIYNIKCKNSSIVCLCLLICLRKYYHKINLWLHLCILTGCF